MNFKENAETIISGLIIEDIYSSEELILILEFIIEWLKVHQDEKRFNEAIDVGIAFGILTS